MTSDDHVGASPTVRPVTKVVESGDDVDGQATFVTADARLAHRLERSERVAARLKTLSETKVLELLADGVVLGSGIGGTRSLVMVDGDPVFAKRVPLTDLERQPATIGSTANLFDLPVACQYGVGSPSFGVWREVASATMATNWVAAGSARSFPLLAHWRILPVPAFDGPLPDELGDIDALVAHWHDSRAVRRRADAIARSTAAVVMFFEYIPKLLPDHLSDQLRARTLTDAAIESTCGDLVDTAAAMNAAGLWHFDTHDNNILTDDHGVYLTDFGLAVSPRFDLSTSEMQFLEANRTHDVAFIATRLVNWIVTNVGGLSDREQRDAAIRRIADGEPVDRVMTGPGTAVVTWFAPIASEVNRFYERLHGHDRRSVYPTAEIRAAWQRLQAKGEPAAS